MLKEYCDKCKKEIKDSEFVIHEGEDAARWTVTRIEIKVTRGPDREHRGIKGEPFDYTVDILCPSCAEAWMFVND